MLVIAGPTCSGKTALAVAAAQALAPAEIINADSMQLYVGMDIGTAKLAPEERGGVPHHLIDVWPIAKSAAVAEYQAMARAAIADIRGRGEVAVLVGGSGLYVRGTLDKLDFPGESANVRARLVCELEQCVEQADLDLDPSSEAVLEHYTNARRNVEVRAPSQVRRLIVADTWP